MLLREIQEIFAVIVFGHGLGDGGEMLGGNPALFEGDFLEAGHLEALSFLDDLDEGRGLGE